MGRHIRRPRSDLDLICPSFMTANVPWEIAYSPLFTHLTVKNIQVPLYLLFCFYPMRCRLSYSEFAYKPYTRISPLHDRRDCWYFGGVATAPPVAALTPIQRKLFTTASIILPTRILPLPAIAKAPHLRFGGSPATTITSRLLPQRLSSRIRDSFDLTFLARLSTLVQRICTEFLLFSL